MHITLIAGARPNFMKIAPLIRAIQQAEAAGKDIHYRLVHTGQHFDKNMSDTFFEELHIPAPDVNLGCGGGTQAEQVAHIMVAFEKDLMTHPTDLVMVVGDVSSTMACAIVAKKMCVRVAHVEAGIRSWDLTMPEEINRMVTDALADYYFTTTQLATDNLLRSGARMGNEAGQSGRIWLVGNVMIDTLLANRERFCRPQLYDAIGLQRGRYIVLTMHRPANVDEESHLRAMMEQIMLHVANEPIVFPLHPRTAKLLLPMLDQLPGAVYAYGECIRNEANSYHSALYIVEPMGYLEFNYLVENSRAVITDSGGITEETTVMGIPCITLRDNTERPETCTIGTNELIGTNPDAIAPALMQLYAGEWKKGGIPQWWDGKTAERIIEVLLGLEELNA